MRNHEFQGLHGRVWIAWLGGKSSFTWELQKELGITEVSMTPKTWISQREAPTQAKIMSGVGF